MRLWSGIGFAVALMPFAAQADVWSEFETRCLIPFEHQSFADISGLKPVETAVDLKRYEIVVQDAAPLVLELEDGPEDGLRSCSVSQGAVQSARAFASWIADRVAQELYVEIEDGRWHSVHWIEPVLEIQLRQEGAHVALRIVETELET